MQKTIMHQDISKNVFLCTHRARARHILLLCACFGSFLVFSCMQGPISQSAFALGTTLTIQVVQGTSRRDTQKAIQQAFENTKRLEQLMSTSAKDYTSSELMDLNAQSRRAAEENNRMPRSMRKYIVSPDTFEVISQSLRVSSATDGAFDITIEPLVRLWGFGADEQHVPSQSDISRALAFVHWKTIRAMHPSAIMLEDGQSIDAGGIAKGYAADQAAAILVSLGVKAALLDFGGNIRTIGHTKPDGGLWRIGIQAPFDNQGTIVGTVAVGETSVVTSGVYERFFEKDGVHYFHILDPKTGFPAQNGLAGVSIITLNGALADGFSTGVFILGLERGMELVERTPDMDAIFITDKKEVYTTSRLEKNFVLISDEYRIGVRKR